LRRGITENYLFVLYNGTLEVYDLNTGLLATVTDMTDGDGYLASEPGVLDVDNFRVQTVDDATFIVNRSKIPAYTSATFPGRPKEAMIFVAGSNYLTRYSVTINYNGVNYSWYYQTPDNSASGNESFILTNNVAASLVRALTGGAATSFSTSYGTGATSAGDAGGSGSGTTSSVGTPGTTLAALGFNCEINGNLIHIWRTDGNDFQIDVNDGSGGTLIEAFKGTVQSFSDLPLGGFSGFILQVVGQATSTSSVSFWMQYTISSVASRGYWQECPAPGVKTTLDPTTMPHQIFTPSPDQFQIEQNTWQPRISGDAITSALDPGFVGVPILAIGFYQGRLMLLTEGTVDWSQTANEFAWFPASSQTVLDTDPISIKLASSDQTALLRTATMIDESLIIWAQLAQFRVNSGVQPFTPSTIQYPESTNYEFVETANMARVTEGLYLPYEPSAFATILSLQYQTGRAAGTTDVTAHIPAYIPAGVRWLSISEQLGSMFVRTDGAPSNLYMYSFLGSGESIVQSAWNCWRLPQGTIRFQSIYRQWLYVLHERPDGMALLRYPLNLYFTDVGQTDYLTRLDMRITEMAVTSLTYSPILNSTAITLPYSLASAECKNLRIAVRTAGVKPRGYLMDIQQASGNTVIVRGDLTNIQFYVGLKIDSMRTESTFFLRTTTGTIPTERMTVKRFNMSIENSGYTRQEIIDGSGTPRKKEFFPVNPQASEPVLGASPFLGSGQLTIDCETLSEALTVSTVNDSHLPSYWTDCSWDFIAVERPVPMLGPYGGPVQ
jgi:hypothetical protein